MRRREFLTRLGKWVLLLAAPTLPGCKRLLGTRASSSGRPNRPAPSQRAPSSSPKTATHPDLVVVKGADPARNLRVALGKLGGIERFVAKGDHVVIKPNLTTPMAPEYAVTTNPLVIAELVRLCRRAGAGEIVVLDRGGESQEEAFEVSGIGRAVREAGGRVKILFDADFRMRRLPKAVLLKRWPLAKEIFEADVVINVPIAKHHDMAGLTMAMKNLMGIMGGDRMIMHSDFSRRIADLNTLVRPNLVVLDAHRILVANGPLGGDLADVRRKNTLIAGTNPVSVDAYGTTLFGKVPTDLDYLVEASRRGLGEIDLRRLAIAGERLGT